MTFDEAKKLLSASIRSELRDHAFGDREIYWDNSDGHEVAQGYLGGGEHDYVGVCHTPIDHTSNKPHPGSTPFLGEEARELARLGKFGAVERNDSTGPDQYRDGDCMPGLTLAGVFQELTGE